LIPHIYLHSLHLINPSHIPTQPTSRQFPTYTYTAYNSLIPHIYLHSFHRINSQHIPKQPTSHESLTFTLIHSLHFIKSFLESLVIIFSGYQLMYNQVVLRYLGTSKLTIVSQIIRSLVACEQAPGWVDGLVRASQVWSTASGESRELEACSQASSLAVRSAVRTDTVRNVFA